MVNQQCNYFVLTQMNKALKIICHVVRVALKNNTNTNIVEFFWKKGKTDLNKHITGGT